MLNYQRVPWDINSPEMPMGRWSQVAPMATPVLFLCIFVGAPSPVVQIVSDPGNPGDFQGLDGLCVRCVKAWWWWWLFYLDPESQMQDIPVGEIVGWGYSVYIVNQGRL